MNIYVDVTFGGGGHSREIISRLSEGAHLYSFDQDADAERNVVANPNFTGEEVPIHLTKSEIAKGYYLKWATPQEIYDTNIAMEKDPWIIRDTAFIKMILDGKIAALQGIL